MSTRMNVYVTLPVLCMLLCCCCFYWQQLDLKEAKLVWKIKIMISCLNNFYFIISFTLWPEWTWYLKWFCIGKPPLCFQQRLKRELCFEVCLEDAIVQTEGQPWYRTVAEQTARAHISVPAVCALTDVCLHGHSARRVGRRISQGRKGIFSAATNLPLMSN